METPGSTFALYAAGAFLGKEAHLKKKKKAKVSLYDLQDETHLHPQPTIALP